MPKKSSNSSDQNSLSYKRPLKKSRSAKSSTHVEDRPSFEDSSTNSALPPKRPVVRQPPKNHARAFETSSEEISSEISKSKTYKNDVPKITELKTPEAATEHWEPLKTDTSDSKQISMTNSLLNTLNPMPPRSGWHDPGLGAKF